MIKELVEKELKNGLKQIFPEATVNNTPRERVGLVTPSINKQQLRDLAQLADLHDGPISLKRSGRGVSIKFTN